MFQENELSDVEYYKDNPQYSECHCLKCKEKSMRIIGIHRTEEYYREERTLYKCEKCGQMAYIDIEWVFSIPTNILGDE